MPCFFVLTSSLEKKCRTARTTHFVFLKGQQCDKTMVVHPQNSHNYNFSYLFASS